MKQSLKVPILVYHYLTPEQKVALRDEADFYTVTAEEFEKQMAYLRENGYQTITLEDFLNYQQGRHSIPDKSIILTFDDGHISNYEIAWPILKKYGFSATFFVVVENIGWQDFLNWEKMKKLASDGICFGSHGLSHRFLTSLSSSVLENELKDSKEILEEQLGISVDCLSLPGGFYNKRVRRLAQSCGYKAVCTSIVGLNGITTDRFSLQRIAVKSNTTLEEFEKLLNLPDSALFLKRLASSGRRALKGMIGVDNYTTLKEKLVKAGR